MDFMGYPLLVFYLKISQTKELSTDFFGFENENNLTDNRQIFSGR